MDAGLYTLQQSTLIIGNLWIVGDQGVKQRLLMLLHQQVCSAVCQRPVHYAVIWGLCPCTVALPVSPAGVLCTMSSGPSTGMPEMCCAVSAPALMLYVVML